MRPPGVGPRELLVAITSSARDAVDLVATLATLITLWAMPGDATVLAPGPLFPAEIVATFPKPSTTPSQNRE